MAYTGKLIASLALAVAATVQALAWEPAGDLVKTPWAAEVNPAAPHPEYPRPQLVRSEWQSLNGLWDYAITPADAPFGGAEGKILVPFCPESSLSGVQRKVGRGNALWYERSFTVPRKWKGSDVMLNFGAVDWQAEIWVNGIKVGEHSGGYAPFSINIGAALRKSGRQTLRLRVLDESDMSFQPRGKQIENPHGIWYTPVTGIWQSVWMEPVPKEARIISYNPVWDADSGELSLTLKAEGGFDEARVVLYDGASSVDDSGKVAEGPVVAEGTFSGAELRLPVPEPRLWSPGNPYIYGLRLSLLKGGKEIDSAYGYTCLRSICVASDPKPDRNVNSYRRFSLNGERTFFFGPLDQGWWPDGLYTAATDEALRFDVEKVKKWGWNMIRKHVKVEPARWYWWCDRLGVTVWQDMPCIADHSKANEFRDPEIAAMQTNRWQRNSFLSEGTECTVPERWKQNYYKEWGEIIDALKCFQCITVWIPFNEAWGQFDTKEVVAFTRLEDPTRLVNEASGGNYALAGDILDTHNYACPSMDFFESRLVNVIGEYGGLGYPVPGHLWQEERNWGYGKVLGSGEEVQELYERFAEMLKTYIGMGCAAAVYTQISDVEIEVNGIMTYDRKVVKLDEARLRETNAAVINSLK
ncbi:MAG: beta-galactosidase [Bacteroidales bacterium]|nr:beta-galactosidase [Bacteroidales bacterium]